MHLIPATPGFLDALGARVVAGRLLQAQDLSGDRPVVVISRSVARGLFGDRQPVDRDLVATIPGSGNVRPRVVGVVEDVHYDGLDAAAGGAIYLPWNRLPLGVVSLVVRTAGAPLPAVSSVRGILQQLDPGVPIEDVVTLDNLATRSIGDRRLQVVIAIGFALLTLTIAVLGLVAVLMRSIAERRHELAIRAAIGSSPAQTRRSVLRHAAGLTGLGLACGLAGAAARRARAGALAVRRPALRSADVWRHRGRDSRSRAAGMPDSRNPRESDRSGRGTRGRCREKVLRFSGSNGSKGSGF